MWQYQQDNYFLFVIDINECKLPKSCDRNAKCTNNLGSFKCDCKPGYQGDGKSCESNF